jgi:AcrR family transcriptional regulator
MAREPQAVAGQTPPQLPLLDVPAPPERADAARNRRRILQAAERLFAQHGIERVSMDAVAEAAGVGKGTLYRHFGDRSGLALALLDERARDFQAVLLHGPPPLGPGSPPGARLRAFGASWLDLLDAHGDLVLVSETGSVGARFREGVYGFYRLHVALLLREARPDLDAEYLADALLAPLSAVLFRWQRQQLGMSLAQIKAGYDALLAALLTTGP